MLVFKQGFHKWFEGPSRFKMVRKAHTICSENPSKTDFIVGSYNEKIVFEQIRQPDFLKLLGLLRNYMKPTQTSMSLTCADVLFLFGNMQHHEIRLRRFGKDFLLRASRTLDNPDV